MTSRLSFRRNFAWNFAGNALYNAAQWILIVSLTHLSDPHVVGQFSLMLAISAPIFLAIGMNLRTAQATDVKGQFYLSDYLRLRLALNIVATVVILCAGFGIGFRDDALIALLFLGVAKSVEGTSQSYYGFFQLHERLDLVSRSLIARSVLGPLFFIMGFRVTDSLSGAVFGLSVGWMAVQFLVDRPFAWKLHKNVFGRPIFTTSSTMETMGRLARLCAPLGVDAGVSSVTVNIPRYALQAILGASQLAMFAALAYLSQVVSMVTSAMATVLVPRLATYYHHAQRRAFVRLLTLLVCFGAAVSTAGVVGAIVLGELILELIFDPEYVNVDLLAVLMVSAGATTIQRSLCKGLEAARRFSTYMLVDIVTALTTLAAAIPLIQAYGLLGAAWSLVAGFAMGSLLVLGLLVGVVRDMPVKAE